MNEHLSIFGHGYLGEQAIGNGVLVAGLAALLNSIYPFFV
jgi:hypothetical protein